MSTENAVESVESTTEVATAVATEVAAAVATEVATAVVANAAVSESELAEAVVHTSVSAVIEGVKAKGKPGRKIVPGSNLQRAKSIFTRMAGAERADVVAAFVADKIPKPSANTYYHLIKNASSNPS
jgi:hypothetical protein